MPKRKRKSTKKAAYSKGELNRLTDDFLHPFYRNNQWVRLLDGIAHAAIERDLITSAKKFVRYNIRDILEEILKEK